jgi:hypothetical protein
MAVSDATTRSQARSRFAATAHCEAVDACDEGLADPVLDQATEAPLRMNRGVDGASGGDLAQVGAGTERAACSRDDDDVHVVIVGGLLP